MSVGQTTKLGELHAGQRGTIIAIEGAETLSSISRRLMEMGFLEGTVAEVVHVAPFGADPIAVRVRGTLVALRRQEASLVTVQLDPERGQARE